MKLLKHKAMFMIYLIIAMSFSIYLITPAEAQAEKVCCEKTKSGEYCLYSDVSDCNPAYQKSRATCDQTSFCEVGCCYNENTGQCFKNAPRTKCRELGGTWSDDPTCSISQCQKGCCQISDQCNFITKVMCKNQVSNYPNVPMIFDESIQTELECKDKCRSQELGACVYSDKSCTFTTREFCLEPRGVGKEGFYPNMLCSHPELDTICAKQNRKECYDDGKLYWFDSCGNRGNIVMPNKEDSYNNGFVLPEYKYCKADPDDTTCGNCEYDKGTICGEVDGTPVCRDINCKKTTESPASPDATGGLKKAGETWCLYEAAVGYGRDVVGSRHLKAECQNGEEIIHECEDYREEICIQSVSGGEPTTDLGSLFELGEGYSEAFCKENRVDDCVDCNLADDPEECCLDIKIRDCFWSGGLCSPHVSKGLEFWEEADNFETAKEICAQGSSICDVKWERKPIGSTGKSEWECTKNCQCIGNEWVKAANQKCIAMGDCGAYYNVEGEFTNEGATTSTTSGMTKTPIKIMQSMVPKWKDIIFPETENNELSRNLGTALIFSAPGLYVIGEMVYLGIFAKAPLDILAPGAFLGPAIVIAAFALLITAVIDQFGTKTKRETVQVICKPWEQPYTKDDCEKCNTGLSSCTEYRCRSLGKFCELINIGSENEKCVYKDPYDFNAPIITPGDPPVSTSEKEDYKYTKTDYGYEVTNKIPIYTPVTLSINTDEPAKCRFSLKPGTSYEDMVSTTGAPFGSTFYDYNHTITFNLPSQLIEEEILKLTNGGKYTLYIRCEDSHCKDNNCDNQIGNTNKKDYYIKFEIDEGPDLTPPVIEESTINNGAYIAADKEKIDFSLFLNEPANCRWSKINVDYTTMSNIFTCESAADDTYSIYRGLYECKTNLDVEKEKVNNYFFRCEDTSGNVNTEAMPVDGKVPFTLISTIPLEITSVEPEGKVYTSTPNLIVKTAAGAENGLAFCGYSETNDEIYNMIRFLETNSTIHRQQLALTSGDYKFYIKCMDKAGNIAEDSTDLDVEADITAPKVTKAYIDAVKNVLVLETSEETTCEYASQTFNYGSGTPMVGTMTTQHQATLQDIFYVICKDEYDNELSVVIYP